MVILFLLSLYWTMATTIETMTTTRCQCQRNKLMVDCSLHTSCCCCCLWWRPAWLQAWVTRSAGSMMRDMISKLPKAESTKASHTVAMTGARFLSRMNQGIRGGFNRHQAIELIDEVPVVSVWVRLNSVLFLQRSARMLKIILFLHRKSWSSMEVQGKVRGSQKLVVPVWPRHHFLPTQAREVCPMIVSGSANTPISCQKYGREEEHAQHNHTTITCYFGPKNGMPTSDICS